MQYRHGDNTNHRIHNADTYRQSQRNREQIADQRLSDGGDFNFIKKNDSRSDNGGWILIVGIVLILLSIAGISYTVVSAVKNRKSTAGFSSDKNNVTFASKSKFDTAEVKLPKRAKHSGGKRFK